MRGGDWRSRHAARTSQEPAVNRNGAHHRTARPIRTRRPRRTGRALWRPLVELPLIAAITVGGYLALDSLLRHSKENQRRPADNGGAVVTDWQPPLDEWQKEGPGGWELLFAEACKGMPGYIVDVGRPARLKLTELGPRVRPLILEKLKSRNYAERICAIQVLGSIGESPRRIAQLLTHELRRATLRRHEIGVLKCATTLPSRDPVLTHLSLLALKSKHAKTRRLAAEYLRQLRYRPHAPNSNTRTQLWSPPPTSRSAEACRTSRLGRWASASWTRRSKSTGGG